MLEHLLPDSEQNYFSSVEGYLAIICDFIPSDHILGLMDFGYVIN